VIQLLRVLEAKGYKDGLSVLNVMIGLSVCYKF
jgi:hypothetical protein